MWGHESVFRRLGIFMSFREGAQQAVIWPAKLAVFYFSKNGSEWQNSDAGGGVGEKRFSTALNPPLPPASLFYHSLPIFRGKKCQLCRVAVSERSFVCAVFQRASGVFAVGRGGTGSVRPGDVHCGGCGASFTRWSSLRGKAFTWIVVNSSDGVLSWIPAVKKRRFTSRPRYQESLNSRWQSGSLGVGRCLRKHRLFWSCRWVLQLSNDHILAVAHAAELDIQRICKLPSTTRLLL